MDTPQTRNLYAPQWWLGQVKGGYGNELRLLDDLSRRNVDAWCPLVERTRKDAGKLIKSSVPLFAGWAAFFGDGETRYAVMLTQRLCKIDPIIDQPRFIREMQSVSIAVAANPQAMIHRGFVVGKLCRIVRGPYMGAEGVVEFLETGKARLVVRVATLGQSVAVDISADDVEPLD